MFRFAYAPYNILRRYGISGPTPILIFGKYKERVAKVHSCNYAFQYIHINHWVYQALLWYWCMRLIPIIKCYLTTVLIFYKFVIIGDSHAESINRPMGSSFFMTKFGCGSTINNKSNL